jgi:hypothetical protein
MALHSVPFDDLQPGDLVRVFAHGHSVPVVGRLRGFRREPSGYYLVVGNYINGEYPGPATRSILTSKIERVEVEERVTDLIGSMVRYGMWPSSPEDLQVTWGNGVLEGIVLGGIAFRTQCGSGRVVYSPDRILTIEAIDAEGRLKHGEVI